MPASKITDEMVARARQWVRDTYGQTDFLLADISEIDLRELMETAMFPDRELQEN